MELFSIFGIVILILLVVFFGRILTVALKVLFYVLIAVFVLIFVFGIPYTQIIDWVSGAVMWVL